MAPCISAEFLVEVCRSTRMLVRSKRERCLGALLMQRLRRAAAPPALMGPHTHHPLLAPPRSRQVPYIAAQATVYSLLTYWMIGFEADAGKFFW